MVPGPEDRLLMKVGTRVRAIPRNLFLLHVVFGVFSAELDNQDTICMKVGTARVVVSLAEFVLFATGSLGTYPDANDRALMIIGNEVALVGPDDFLAWAVGGL